MAGKQRRHAQLQRARDAHAAVQSFRERYGLDGHERALEGSATEAR